MDRYTRGLTSGAFDLFHLGHLRYIQRCKDQCDDLIIAVYSDELVKTQKGEGRPIVPARERIKILEALKYCLAVCEIGSIKEIEYLSKAFNAKKIFKTETDFELHPVIGDYETSAETIVIQSIPSLPETSRRITTIVERFKHKRR